MSGIRRKIEAHRREKEIERLNNPRRMIFVSDVLLMGLFAIVAMVVMWFGIVGTCHLMYAVQTMLGIA